MWGGVVKKNTIKLVIECWGCVPPVLISPISYISYNKVLLLTEKFKDTFAWRGGDK